MAQIGQYSLSSIETGRFGLDGGAMFGIVPKPLWSQRIEPDDSNRIPLHMRCLLLEGPDRVILVDVGVGDLFSGTKYEDIYAVDHKQASLEQSLAEEGIGPSEVTDVVLTHLHFDHAGGATKGRGDGRTLRFPNATYHVQREHWNWATDPNPKEKGSFIPEALSPLEESGQLRLVEGAGTLFPGISVELVHGHTQAQQIVTVADEETTLVYVADLLPTTHHLPAAWTMAYDIRPLRTIEEKRDFLERAVEANWNLFFEHDPNVAVGSLDQTDRGIEVVRPRTVNDV